ncbi:MAG: NERD domain-containing protein [Mogibacterium sp.]|nr:NERD domain-containing protein [Mogibacterium sp.]
MDDSGSSIIILLIICVIAILALAGRFSKSPERQGEIGELNIVSILSKSLRKGLYGKVLHNLYIPKADGGTSEIDVLLVCTKGIFVFESKDFVGWIFGDDKSKYWTVTLYAGKDLLGFKKTEKHQFYNPIWQNNAHISNLNRLFENTIPMNSIVVFSDRSELKDVVNNSETTILQTSYLKTYLSVVRTSYDDVLSTITVDRIYNQLLLYTDNNDEEKKQKHLTYVKEQKYNPSICPRCGGKLVVRTAKRGDNVGKQFYGCSNYPKCKYTRNIESSNESNQK